MNERFSLLFLCTGNRFRSPLAAAMLRRLTLTLPVDVTSAGLLDVGAAPALSEAVRLAAWSGVSLADHRARHLSPDVDAHVDVVLGFEQAHVTAAVVDGGIPAMRAFTLHELNRLLARVPPVDATLPVATRARERVRRASELRSTPAGPADEIVDPFGRSRRVARATANEIRHQTLELARRLFDVDPADVLLEPSP